MTELNDDKSTVKSIEAKVLLMEIDQKTQHMRAIGTTLLLIICVGVIASVVLIAIIFVRQNDDRQRDIRRNEQQVKQGNVILQNVYDRINNIDENLSDHVGKEPLPPLVVSTTTTTIRQSTTTTIRRATTTTSPPQSTTTAPPASTTTQPPPTTTTTAPPKNCVVAPVCLTT